MPCSLDKNMFPPCRSDENTPPRRSPALAIPFLLGPWKRFAYPRPNRAQLKMSCACRPTELLFPSFPARPAYYLLVCDGLGPGRAAHSGCAVLSLLHIVCCE